MKNKKRIRLSLIVLLGIIPFLFIIPNQKAPVIGQPETENNTQPAPVLSDSLALPTETETMIDVEKTIVPVLSLREQVILDELSRCMESYQLEKAAIILAKCEDQLMILFNDTLQGERYLYQNGQLTKDINGRGLVLYKASVLFYGSFVSGKPEGFATALQSIVLDQPRYDYSSGIWLNGAMDGYGKIGYQYYGDDKSITYSMSEKSGNFIMDYMDGEITYINNHDQETLSWYLDVIDGVLQFNGDWEHLSDEGKYRLPAVEDAGHVYVVDEDMAGKTQWRNMILWRTE